MDTDTRTGAALIATMGLLAGVALTLFTTEVSDTGPQCHEDEVIVWTNDTHGACVTLDDMWYDADTDTVHWFYADQR